MGGVCSSVGVPLVLVGDSPDGGRCMLIGGRASGVGG